VSTNTVRWARTLTQKTANHYSKAQYAPLKDLKKTALLQPTTIGTDPGADLATLNKS